MAPEFPEYSEQFAGRTPFVSEANFTTWSEKAALKFRQTDPMRQASWSYGMAVAWIVFRSTDGVREYGDSYALLAQIEAQNDAEDDDDGLVKAMTVADADFQLRRALSVGEFAADAVNAADGRPCRIPNHEWSRLEHAPDKNLVDQFRLSDRPLNIAYRDVQLQRAEIEWKWPGAPSAEADETDHDDPADGAAPVVPALVKQEIASLLKRLCQSWENSGRDPLKQIGNREFIAMVTRDDSPDRVRNAKPYWADDIWRKKKPSEWSTPGPRKL
ncbi:hypothetical protein [Mesorhizobium sp. KR9-304]|uniref:hypothetical protein n=1 Tax=Mesorhizobium sp. KR9-304 TaxID=3156614 RepID=UPI0032B33D9A